MTSSLVLEHVSIAFAHAEAARVVLNDISLTLIPGQVVAVVGPNGSGKSTLGRVIAGLLSPSAGSRSWSDEQRDGSCQLVFQTPDAQIVGQTVYEDICFGLENIARPFETMAQTAQQAANQAGLQESLERSVEELSGGQKQLLCVADAIAVDPDFIVFDEATAMLDPSSRQRVFDAALALGRNGTGVVWITQWMEEVAAAHRVLALDAGCAVFDGSPQAFFYGQESGMGASSTSTCSALGLRPPFAVQVAQSLQKRGFALPGHPLSAEELGEVLRP